MEFDDSMSEMIPKRHKSTHYEKSPQILYNQDANSKSKQLLPRNSTSVVGSKNDPSANTEQEEVASLQRELLNELYARSKTVKQQRR